MEPVIVGREDNLTEVQGSSDAKVISLPSKQSGTGASGLRLPENPTSQVAGLSPDPS